MSRLLILTRPELVPVFHLAGVEAYAADDAEEAQRLVAGWLAAGETGLLAIDDGLFAGFEPAARRRLEASQQLPFMLLPGGEPLAPGSLRRRRIAELIRRAVGFHITFRGETSGGEGHSEP